MTRLAENLTRLDIEARAESLLQRVYQDGLPSLAIDVEAILERYCQLTLFVGKPEDIGQQSGILGAIFFEEREVFINESLLHDEGRFRFTVAHELGHWFLHHNVVDPIVFAWPYVPGMQRKGRHILCRASESTLLEFQANRFAAALLMPRWAFSRRLHSLAGQALATRRGDSGYIVDVQTYESMLGTMAVEFSVSKAAAALRLKELGLIEVDESPGQLRWEL